MCHVWYCSSLVHLWTNNLTSAVEKTNWMNFFLINCFTKLSPCINTKYCNTTFFLSFKNPGRLHTNRCYLTLRIVIPRKCHRAFIKTRSSRYITKKSHVILTQTKSYLVLKQPDSTLPGEWETKRCPKSRAFKIRWWQPQFVWRHVLSKQVCSALRGCKLKTTRKWLAQTWRS